MISLSLWLWLYNTYTHTFTESVHCHSLNDARKKLDGIYTRMVRAILNKSWKQHSTKQQLYGQLPPISKSNQVRLTRHARHCWRSKDEVMSDVLLWTPRHGRASAGRRARTYLHQFCTNPDVVWKTCREQWTIGTDGVRESGKSVLST